MRMVVSYCFIFFYFALKYFVLRFFVLFVFYKFKWPVCSILLDLFVIDIAAQDSFSIIQDIFEISLLFVDGTSPD